jgi:hypothetical protein
MYVPIEGWVYLALDCLAVNLQVRPEQQLNLEDQAEWWRFPLLSATPKHNDDFTIQFSYRPAGRAK